MTQRNQLLFIAVLAVTAPAPAAEFESSNDPMNRICQTVNWTYRCLTIGGYVVDCPHRERLGCGGEEQWTPMESAAAETVPP
jgi:alpha-L-rhamnosidase